MPLVLSEIDFHQIWVKFSLNEIINILISPPSPLSAYLSSTPTGFPTNLRPSGFLEWLWGDGIKSDGTDSGFNTNRLQNKPYVVYGDIKGAFESNRQAFLDLYFNSERQEELLSNFPESTESDPAKNYSSREWHIRDDYGKTYDKYCWAARLEWRGSPYENLVASSATASNFFPTPTTTQFSINRPFHGGNDSNEGSISSVTYNNIGEFRLTLNGTTTSITVGTVVKIVADNPESLNGYFIVRYKSGNTIDLQGTDYESGFTSGAWYSLTSSPVFSIDENYNGEFRIISADLAISDEPIRRVSIIGDVPASLNDIYLAVKIPDSPLEPDLSSNTFDLYKSTYETGFVSGNIESAIDHGGSIRVTSTNHQMDMGDHYVNITSDVIDGIFKIAIVDSNTFDIYDQSYSAPFLGTWRISSSWYFPEINPIGAPLLFLNGPNKGEVRKIVDYQNNPQNSNERRLISLDPALPYAPNHDDQIRIFASPEEIKFQTDLMNTGYKQILSVLGVYMPVLNQDIDDNLSFFDGQFKTVLCYDKTVYSISDNGSGNYRIVCGYSARNSHDLQVGDKVVFSNIVSGHAGLETVSTVTNVINSYTFDLNTTYYSGTINSSTKFRITGDPLSGLGITDTGVGSYAGKITNVADNGSGKYRITSLIPHGLSNGCSVAISGGNSSLNTPSGRVDGAHLITVVDEFTFDLTWAGGSNQSITSVSNSSGKFQVTSTGHGLTVGNNNYYVTISSNLDSLNGTWMISVIDSNSFNLYNSVYESGFTSGNWKLEVETSYSGPSYTAFTPTNNTIWKRQNLGVWAETYQVSGIVDVWEIWWQSYAEIGGSCDMLLFNGEQYRNITSSLPAGEIVEIAADYRSKSYLKDRLGWDTGNADTIRSYQGNTLTKVPSFMWLKDCQDTLAYNLNLLVNKAKLSFPSINANCFDVSYYTAGLYQGLNPQSSRQPAIGPGNIVGNYSVSSLYGEYRSRWDWSLNQAVNSTAGTPTTVANNPDNLNSEWNAFIYNCASIKLQALSYIFNGYYVTAWDYVSIYGSNGGEINDLWYEIIFHALLSGGELFDWNSNQFALQDGEYIQNAITEAEETLVSSVIPILETPPDWDAPYVSTKADVRGKIIWRITPSSIWETSVTDNPVTFTFKELQGPSYTSLTGNIETLEIPNAELFVPESQVSTAGYWVIQTIEASTPEEELSLPKRYYYRNAWMICT